MTIAFLYVTLFLMQNIQEVKTNLKKIKELVKHTDLKYKDVADTLDVDIATLSRWVREKHFPTKVYHPKIAEIAKFYDKVKVSK